MSGGQLRENKTVETNAPSLISCFLTTANKASQAIPTVNTTKYIGQYTNSNFRHRRRFDLL